MSILTTFTGPMFSGKSEKLIHRVRRSVATERVTQVFTSAIDNRHGVGHIRSHSGQTLDVDGIGVWAVADDEVPGLARRVRENTTVVAFDEAQFFPPSLLGEIRSLLNRGVTVYAAGLDRDFRDEPFGIMPQLLALSDVVEKLKAVCAGCKAENAVLSFRRSLGMDQVLIGASEAYEARCRPCYLQAMKVRK